MIEKVQFEGNKLEILWNILEEFESKINWKVWSEKKIKNGKSIEFKEGFLWGTKRYCRSVGLKARKCIDMMITRDEVVRFGHLEERETVKFFKLLNFQAKFYFQFL